MVPRTEPPDHPAKAGQRATPSHPLGQLQFKNRKLARVGADREPLFLADGLSPRSRLLSELNTVGVLLSPQQLELLPGHRCGQKTKKNYTWNDPVTRNSTPGWTVCPQDLKTGVPTKTCA